MSINRKKFENFIFQGGGLLGLFGISILRGKGFREIDCIEMIHSRGQLIKDMGATFILGKTKKEKF